MFENQAGAVLSKTSGTGQSNIGWLVNNQGTVDAQVGTLQLDSFSGDGLYLASTGELRIANDRLRSGNWVVQDQGILTIGTTVLNSIDAGASLELNGNASFADETGVNGSQVAILENKGRLSLKNGALYQSPNYDFLAGQKLTNTGEILVDGSSSLQHGVLNRGLISGSGNLQRVSFEAGEIIADGTLTIDNIEGAVAGLTTLTSGTLSTTNLNLSEQTLRMTGNSQLQGNSIAFGENSGLEIEAGSLVSSPNEISLYRANLLVDGEVNGNVNAVQSQILGTGSLNGNLVAVEGTSIGTDSILQINGNLGLNGIVTNGTVVVNGMAAVDSATIDTGATLTVTEGTAITRAALPAPPSTDNLTLTSSP